MGASWYASERRMMKTTWDYEILAYCQYEVGGDYGIDADCGEAAIALVTWFREDGEEDGTMYVCAEHLQQMRDSEKEEDDRIGIRDN